MMNKFVTLLPSLVIQALPFQKLTNRERDPPSVEYSSTLEFSLEGDLFCGDLIGDSFKDPPL